MALHFHKTEIVLSSTTLRNLVQRYEGYTVSVVYPTVDEDNFKKCKATIALLESGIRQLREGRENLRTLYREVRDEYRNCKNKSEKKDLMAEIEQIEEESRVQTVIAEASDLIFKLTARIDESRCAQENMGIELGYITQKVIRNDVAIADDADNQNAHHDEIEQNSLSNDTEANNSQSTTSRTVRLQQNEAVQRVHRSIKPPQATLPKFFGNSEEFAEFWAIFETLVHKNEELDVIEKIILLKESLKGRAKTSIQGIQPLPENYNWMVKTLKDSYCDYSANRSQIVQKLMNMKPANNFADSCSMVLDQIQVLINQMVSAGFDVRNTCDPIWGETILAKFPRDIVKPVLISGQTMRTQTIENLMGQLKKEVAAKSYVENRLGKTIEHRSGQTFKNKVTTLRNDSTLRPYTNQECIFCHKGNHMSVTCRTVADQSSRRKILKEENRCWKCFSSNHNSYDCEKPDCTHCGQKHHSSLCFKKESTPTGHNYTPWNGNQRSTRGGQNSSKPNFAQNRNQGQSKSGERRNFTNNLHTEPEIINSAISQQNQCASQLVLMTAEGNLWNFKKQEYTKALFFFDSGAQKTVIEESLANELGLPKYSTEICTMSGIGGHIENFKSDIVLTKINTAFGEEIEMQIQTKPVLTNGFPSVRLTTADVTFLKENNIYLANSKLRGEHQKPHILVGLDYYHDLISGPSHTLKTPSGLQITKTVFGPTVYGKGLLTAENLINNTYYGLTAVIEQTEQEMLQKMFELDGLGISEDECHKDDKVHNYLDNYSKLVSYKNGHITAPFPLKDNISQLEDNYCVAIRRLESLQKTLLQNPEQSSWYCRILQKYIQENTIEPFLTAEKDAVGTYYMPHSGVWKPNKQVPLRIVFDASSKRRNKLSLNDVIHKGESFINKIHDILVSSRTKNIILMCDIEAAFTQIHLTDSHKDLCRFLWVKNINLPPTRENLIQYRFKRLPFGVTASPSILNMALTSFLNSQSSKLTSEIASNLYVDNIMMQADTPKEAMQKYNESKKIFTKIGMNLREYISNSTEVNSLIPDIDRLQCSSMKILGVKYDINRDSFMVTTHFPPMKELTKKDIVSQINSVYDPIGIAGPLLVHLKTLMREVFNGKTDWKDLVSHEVCNKWNNLTKQVDNACVIIPRLVLGQSSGVNHRLWVFADASSIAMSTCAYLQCKLTSNISPLISGKTRLTPKKIKQTIPRLELVAILMAARLSSNIAAKYNIQEISIASDSEIALYWIKSSKKLPLFVENQRKKILETKSKLESTGIYVNFFHVATTHNPADAGTRGLSSKEINHSDWVKGPQWLQKGPEKWPVRKLDSIELITEESEPIILSNIEMVAENKNKETLFDLNRFSCLNKALRVVAQVGKLTKQWVNLTNKSKSLNIELTRISKFSTETEITSSDVELAEIFIFAQEQRNECFKDLQKRFPDKKLIIDENSIIRHESRLQNAALPHDTKSPIYIPPKSELVRLIVQQIHSDNAHCGKEHTLTIARQRFWIPRASNAFKKYVKGCVTCKKYQGLPLGAPVMPALPIDRVIASAPFQNTGCDFIGPFMSKTQEKMYVALYTCLTTRAVHLEVVENMTTSAFLNSFVRFISRRGVPKLMRTDCGTNFKQGEQIISTMFENDEPSGTSLMSYCATRGIKWIFNPPASPWMGGVWERLVASVKKALNKSVGRRKLSFTEMSTTMARIEAILNTRPLTKLNPDDITEIPLRPIDFLQRNIKFSIPEGGNLEITNDPSYDPELIQSREQAVEAMRFSEIISDKFWECWRCEYLTSLREMQKQHLKQPRHLQRSCPDIGEIVLIEQDLLPRGSWPYGKITEIITSADGLVRSAKILMPNQRIIQRPLNKLYPLEIRSVVEEPHDSTRITEGKVQQQRPLNESEPQNANEISERRQKLSRMSKTRAFDFFRNMDSNLCHLSRSKPMNSSLILLALLSIMISPAIATVNSSIISCSDGVVSVPPLNGWFELCIDDECQSMNNTTRYTRYILPISPTEKGAKVLLRTLHSDGTHVQTRLCERAKFCEHQYLFSKSLLGNPHCWPAGAIATSAVLFYLAIALILVTIWMTRKIIKRIKQQDETTSSVGRQTVRATAPAENFELVPLPGVILALCAVLCLIAPAAACQHGFMRHSAELICNEKNKCHLEYNRELLFNKLQSQLCIEILHANKTVGLARFEKKTVEFKCSKTTEFFTRPSETQIFHSKRCVNAGSCTTRKCETIKANERIPELNHTLKYPGYAGCMSSCGGIFCGCALPLPSCWFYRVVQKPVSERVFEVVRCPHWNPTVKLEIELTINNQTQKFQHYFLPYKTESFGSFNISVLSLQRPSGSIENTRFAIATDRSYLVPQNFQIPIACNTSSQAQSDFASCSNKIRCICSNSPQSCQCPNDSIHRLRDNPQNQLPLRMPHMELISEAGNIIASSNEEEMVLRVESLIMHEPTAELVIHQECGFKILALTGCYNCALGAHFTAICKSPVQATVTVTCQTQQFQVRCGPMDEQNDVILSFDHALVHEQCDAHCSDKPTKFLLNGTLRYHISSPQGVSAFKLESHGIPLSHQWLSDISLPSLEPIVNVIVTHWKMTLGALSATLGLGLLTYLAGPLICLSIAKVVGTIVASIPKTIWKALHYLFSMSKATISTQGQTAQV